MSRRYSAALVLAVSFAVLFAAAPAHAQQAANGKIAGKILDEYNGMTLPTAPVTVVGLDRTVYADLDGQYVVEVPAGTYEVQVTFSGYQDRTVRNVVVVAGRTTQLDIIMFLDNLQYSEEVIVRAEEPEANTDAAALLERARSGNIEDNISGKRMRQNADSNAAQAAERVPGLSVVDNSYVFVRGLGARYSNSTLNGIQMPTTEPDKRVVPLDLFPAGMIDQMQVIKTYTPDKPGEFSGGLVELESLSFPQDAAFGVGFKLGSDSQLGDPGLNYAGGSRDWLGFDDGTRALSSTLVPDNERVVRGGIYTDPGFTREELTAIADSFNNEWSPQNFNPGINQGYQAYYGDSWEKFSVVGSYSYRQDWGNWDEQQSVYRVEEGGLTPRSDYDMHYTDSTARQALVGNVAFRPSASNRFLWENFWTHKGQKETRYFEGYNDDFGNDIRDNRLRWIQEDILTSKVSGSHFLQGAGNSRINWWVAYSKADRDEPDLRETLYEDNGGVFELADESQSGFRMWIDQADTIWDGGVDWSLFYDQWDDLPGSMQFGVQANLRDRDFQSRRFRNRQLFTRNVDLSLPAELLFTNANYANGAFELREETRNTDAYTGSQDIYAGYWMIDLPIARTWRFVVGARFEQSDQTVDTFDPFIVGDANADLIRTENDDSDLLPSINLVNQFRLNQNLRFGYSRTVNRPQFRELAPFEFTDVVGGRSIIGNPDLVEAHIDNFDVRWEWFPGATEIVAASIFYKRFTNPIERIVEPTAQLRTSFTNADSARNYGFELELQKILGQYLEAGGNYTYVNSSIDVGTAEGQVQTSTERALAGTSPNLFNAYAELHMPTRALALRFLVNWFDDRIIDVGALGLPDIIEQARAKVDLVFVWSAGNQLGNFPNFNVRVAFENLTDPTYEFTQGGETFSAYTLGRAFNVAFAWDILR
ncbi:MAG: TonB-dependent receptor [Acidobacteriota bacterium]|jgi:outer membrane receptor protein involved in Fe transport